jgi:hypothetical protein
MRSLRVEPHFQNGLHIVKRGMLFAAPAAVDPLNVIKGRIAEALVEELLRACGNNVYRFGYESVLQNLVQADANFNRTTKNGQQVRSIPDFVVVTGHGNPIFVEVKFRADPEWLKKEMLRRIEEFWHAKVVLVTITKPYFRVARLDPDSDSCIFQPLETERDFGVTYSSLRKFEPLVRRFLVNGTAKHHEASRNQGSGQQNLDLDRDDTRDPSEL